MTARIRRSAQFRAFSAGTRRRRGPVSMVAAPSLEPGVPRVAYAIGRGVGSAVTRNRLRRRLRSAVEEVAPRLDRGSAYLVGATKGAIDLTYGELVRAVDELARELAPEAVV